MKIATTLMTLIFVAVFSLNCEAQRPDKKEKGQKGNRDRSAQGQRAGNRNPADMAAKMMKEFDKDGSGALNTRELGALLKSMSERRGGGAQGRRGAQGRPGAEEGRPGMSPEGKQGRGKGEEGARKRGKGGKGGGKKKSQESGATSGGVAPKRPGQDF